MRTKKNISSIILTILLFITSSTFAQNAADTINRQFNDNFLDRLVGKWNVTSIAHGITSTAVLEAEWVL